MSRPYAEVIGDPIAHSKSPLIHNFWLEKLGIDAEYRATHVRSDELAEYFARRREDAEWRGCNVTMPHKGRVAELAEAADESALRVGAANTVVVRSNRLEATNTDIAGIIGALPTDTFVSDALPEACVIGTGGAARAALEGFKRLELANVFINARDEAYANELHDRWGFGGRVGPLDDVHNLTTPHLVINATPLGMNGFASMPHGVLSAIATLDASELVVFDMIYSPVETELLRAAKSRRLRTVDGLQMLVGQAAVAFELFFGQPAPREHDSELRALLTA